jgi:hypothetical protein
MLLLLLLLLLLPLLLLSAVPPVTMPLVSQADLENFMNGVVMNYTPG